MIRSIFGVIYRPIFQSKKITVQKILYTQEIYDIVVQTGSVVPIYEGGGVNRFQYEQKDKEIQQNVRNQQVPLRFWSI